MALHLAIESAGPRVVAVLVDGGADVGARDGAGRTPVELAHGQEVRAVLQWER